MPNLLGVTNPVPGHESTNINRNMPVTPGDSKIQNAPDPTRVSRPDNRTERQDSQDAGGADRALRYDSNFRTFLQRLANTPGLSESMSEIMKMYQGMVVSSGVEEGTAADMAALMRMLKMDEGQLGKFFLSQMNLSSRFGGALFSILREAYGSSSSEVLRSSILQFLKRYSDYTSTNHIEGNLLRTLTRLTRAIPASWGSQLLPMVSQLENLLNGGNRAGALKLLQGTILPFLGSYTSRTNDMGLSRTLISMLALDISRYENGGVDGLLQSFHQLNGLAVLRDKLGAFSDEALLRLIDNGNYAKEAARDQFANQLALTAQRAMQGGAGLEAQEAFRNIMAAILVNESVYMPLTHVMLPVEWEGKMAFGELWVDPDAEENLKQGRGGRDNTIRFLFKIDIEGLGFFDMVLSCQRETVDVQLYCPAKVSPFAGLVEGELGRILTENGLKTNRVQVQEMTKPLTISGVFPQIFEGESGVNVKV
ncbi:MAG: hypothetical protein HFF60_06935 [Oscillospiraceae bacterium]|jgi:hypothetical protein|nr:hypothetical protein [Oscillospiraceae bacterium]